MLRSEAFVRPARKTETLSFTSGPSRQRYPASQHGVSEKHDFPACSHAAVSHGRTQKKRRDVMNQPIEEPYLGETFPALEKTDPDLAAMRARLAREDAESFPDAKTSCLLTMAVLAALQTTGDMKRITEEALRAGATPVEIKETLYQCVPYIGFPRTEAALRPVNEALLAAGVSLPVESCAAVTEENRFSRGLAVQKSIFGDAIDRMHSATPKDERRIMVDRLSAFCFGDIYTRGGLDLKKRELVTFCIISALGGCESKVKSHVQGNANVGNTRQDLVNALTLILPCIGFPRTLNALSCVNEVLPG